MAENFLSTIYHYGCQTYTAVSRSWKSTGTPLVTTLRNEEDRSRWRWSARAHNTPLLSLSLSFSFSFFLSLPFSSPLAHFPLLSLLFSFFFPYLYHRSHSLLTLYHAHFLSFSLLLLPSQPHLPSSFSVSLSPPSPVSLPIPFHLSLSFSLSPSFQPCSTPQTHPLFATHPRIYVYQSLVCMGKFAYVHTSRYKCVFTEEILCASRSSYALHFLFANIREHLFDWYTINIRGNIMYDSKKRVNFFVDLSNGWCIETKRKNIPSKHRYILYDNLG